MPIDTKEHILKYQKAPEIVHYIIDLYNVKY